ncbi:hypothetical protein [Sporosarcina ureilytica]|uniref:Uncharacterized protein n=1 Tax=Sporosarcina ureilytica TaxID=298596 RepID=A0A1D8JGQ1_9BACL|nr:hypothetical protein [Sporosarcina ureilytica]AOV07890.1 hypothetical protein BI350_10320 [Sporosarcina ureilytica]
MESLIPFIIMLLLGSLFSGKKKSSQDEKRPSKPFTAEKQDNPIKKLKEMSRDLYKEIQQEMEQENKKVEQRPVAVPRESFSKAESRKETPIPLDGGRRRETRRDKVKRQSKIKQSNVANRDFVPSSSDDIMKGIIFSEIIGPPKSRR